MSEKRHKINKFANYQNKMVKNSPALTAMFLFLFEDLKTFGPWFLTYSALSVHKSDLETFDDLFVSCENIVWISLKRMNGKQLPLV